MAVALLLMIPLILTLLGSGVDGVGWHWTFFDFIFMGTLLFGAGLVFELISKRMHNGTHRLALVIAVVTGVLLIWINAAVGIISTEDSPVNLMYFGVLAVGFIGAIIGRFQPRGLARALIATAVAQALVPVIALGIIKPQFAPGILKVLVLNAFFAAMWIASALLFRSGNTAVTQNVEI